MGLGILDTVQEAQGNNPLHPRSFNVAYNLPPAIPEALVGDVYRLQ